MVSIETASKDGSAPEDYDGNRQVSRTLIDNIFHEGIPGK